MTLGGTLQWKHKLQTENADLKAKLAAEVEALRAQIAAAEAKAAEHGSGKEEAEKSLAELEARRRAASEAGGAHQEANAVLQAQLDAKAAELAALTAEFEAMKTAMSASPRAFP